MSSRPWHHLVLASEDCSVDRMGSLTVAWHPCKSIQAAVHISPLLEPPYNTGTALGETLSKQAMIVVAALVSTTYHVDTITYNMYAFETQLICYCPSQCTVFLNTAHALPPPTACSQLLQLSLYIHGVILSLYGGASMGRTHLNV